MRSRKLKVALLVLASGGILFQAVSCAASLAGLAIDLLLQFGLNAIFGALTV